MRSIAPILFFAAAAFAAAEEPAPIDPLARELLSWPISASAVAVPAKTIDLSAPGPPPRPDFQRVTDTELSYSEYSIYAYAINHWDVAEPIMTRWLTDASPFRRAAAAAAFYKRALTRGENPSRGRTMLQSLVTNRSLHPSARGMALRSLMLRAAVRWVADDRDDVSSWYLSLFDDPTLTYARIEDVAGRPLADVAAWWPEQLTPALARLARNVTTRNNAAIALGAILEQRDENGASPRTIRRVVEALTPWLAHKEWARESDSGGERLAAIEAAGTIGGPRVLEALRAGFAREPHNVALLAALVARRDPKALSIGMSDREPITENARGAVWTALLRTHAAPPAEIAEALFAFLRLSAKDPRALDNWNNVLPWRASLGRHLELTGTHGAADAIATRIAHATAGDAAVTNGVLAVIAAWDDDAIRALVLRELPRADARVVATVASHARAYRAAARRVANRTPFIALLAGDDVSRFLARPKSANRILVFARLAQIDIPAAQVTASAAHPEVVAQYLAHVDTPAHRALLRARFPHVISGMPPPVGRMPIPCASDAFTKLENELLAEIAAGKSDEVWAHVTFAGWPCGYLRDPRIVRGAMPEWREAFEAAGPAWTIDAWTPSHELFHADRAGARRIVFKNDAADPRVHRLAEAIDSRAALSR